MIGGEAVLDEVKNYEKKEIKTATKAAAMAAEEVDTAVRDCEKSFGSIGMRFKSMPAFRTFLIFVLRVRILAK